MDASEGWAWLGHAGIVLLIAATLAPREGQRAVLLVLAALDGIAASVILLNRPSYALLFALLIVAILVRMAWRHYHLVNVQFSAEEAGMRDRHLAALPPDMARRLLDEGHWLAADKGDVLIDAAQAAPSLFYLAQGAAQVSRGGVECGRCTAGDIIGRALVSDAGAPADMVRLATKAQLWCVPEARLQSFLAAHPQARAALPPAMRAALRGQGVDAKARADMGSDTAQ